MKVSQFDGFVNNATDEILGVKSVNRENLEPMLSTSLSPNITPLIVRRNGVYYPDLGIDGFSPVWVDVDAPAPTPPVINPITITENGTYTPETGVDGYSPITVNVPSSSGLVAEWDFTESQTFIDSIKNIELTPSGSSTYRFVENGIEVLANGFYLILPFMYAANLTYTIEFSKFVNEKTTNIWLMSISGTSSPQSPNKGLNFNKASNVYRVSGYNSPTSTTSNVVTLTGFTIDDNDSISIKMLPSTVWTISKNGIKIIDTTNSLTPALHTYVNFVIGANSSNGSFNPGTIIKKITIS